LNEAESSPRIGQFVYITEGREAGQYAVVVSILDERFVFIADGEKRRFHSPKKKNVNHLEFIDRVSPEVQNSIKETGRVTNGKLRHALKTFVNEQAADLKKGE